MNLFILAVKYFSRPLSHVCLTCDTSILKAKTVAYPEDPHITSHSTEVINFKMADDRTIKSCLTTIFSDDIGPHKEDFGLSGCDTLEEEFKIIKKAYFKNALKSHPDKGGDPSVFREVQASFEGKININIKYTIVNK